MKIIVYLRRQDKFIASNYVQAVKAFPFTKDDFEVSVLTSLHKDAHNYYEHILPWEEAFGAGNIIVRPFERERLKNNNIIDDIFAIIGIGDEVLSGIVQSEDTNISPTPECTLFLQKINLLPINPTKRNSIYHFLFSSILESLTSYPKARAYCQCYRFPKIICSYGLRYSPYIVRFILL